VRVLVTGATGFVARAVMPALAARGHEVRAAARRPVAGADTVIVPDVGPDTDWAAALRGCDAVVHLAARVHVLRDPSADPLAEFRRVNRDGTRRLAEEAVRAGIRRIVHVSTAKVLGESSPPGRPFGDDAAAAPEDPYSVSKWEAERALDDVCRASGAAAVSLRPPLVYGPGVGANFLRLLRAVDARRPLPLGAVANRRSLVYVGNLASAAAACVEAASLPCAACLVTDREDLSTPELIRRIGRALGVRPRLVPVPPAWLRLGGRLLGRGAELDRLLGDFALAPTALAALVGWSPPFDVDRGLAETAAWYRATARAG
jgi:nucleoside-diphosphate-sugar epimerase